MNYNDLSSELKTQTVRLLSAEHLSNDPDSLPIQPIEHGNHPTVLMKDGRVIAALVTDGRQRVHNWAGRIDREFLKEFGHTPAEELLRQHLLNLQGRKRVNLTFSEALNTTAAVNAFYKRLYDNGTPIPALRGDRRTLKIPTEILARLKPALPAQETAWRRFKMPSPRRRYPRKPYPTNWNSSESLK